MAGIVVLALGGCKESKPAPEPTQTQAVRSPSAEPGLVGGESPAAAPLSEADQARLRFFQDKIEAAQKALAQNPGDANLRANLVLYNLQLADVLKNLGQWGEALAAARKAQELEPESLDVRFYIGTLHLDQADYQNAINELETVTEKKPALFGLALSPAWEGLLRARGQGQGKKRI